MIKVPEIITVLYRIVGANQAEVQMSYRITEDCIYCAACKSECENEAIKEGEVFYVIDSDKCTECVGWFESPKCAEVCPVDAAVPDPDRKESREQLLEKWKKLHPGAIPAVS